jgi:hypothetical protein
MAELKLEDGGRLGYFWPLEGAGELDLDADPLRGWVRREEGTTMVDFLDENPYQPGTMDPPQFDALVGVLQGGNVLLLELQGTHRTLAFGAQASWGRVTARTVVESIDLQRMRSERIRGLRADFLGVGRWAGMRSITERWTYGEDRLVNGWSMTLSESEAERIALANSRVLSLTSKWSVKGSDDRRVITAPVSVSCEARTPRPVWHLLLPLIQVQELLQLSYDGSVLASSGAAEMDLDAGVRPGTGSSRCGTEF